MRRISYQSFSLRTHTGNALQQRADSSQYELTYRCDLHCAHCYSDCFNTRAFRKKELGTSGVKHILDKLADSGVVWLCLTGGDPLAREDFCEIYRYAKNKGFIISIFTNGYTMTREMGAFLKDHPPFLIEITLNAATQDTFERITRVPGSYRRVYRGIDVITKNQLPLSIKTQITKQNFHQRDLIRRRIRSLGFKFMPSIMLYPRLDGDLAPCALRLGHPEIPFFKPCDGQRPEMQKAKYRRRKSHTRRSLFKCCVHNNLSINVDPCGNAFQCFLIRKPRVNLARVSVAQALKKLNAYLGGRTRLSRSLCHDCSLRPYCRNCPGQGYLERGKAGAPVEYYCRLAQAQAATGFKPAL